jgi:hypothetical protein
MVTGGVEASLFASGLAAPDAATACPCTTGVVASKAAEQAPKANAQQLILRFFFISVIDPYPFSAIMNAIKFAQDTAKRNHLEENPSRRIG